MKKAVEIKDLEFEYYSRDEEGYLTENVNAIRGINFDAEKGEIVVIVGKNGSGKSTLAKIMNRLLVPDEGTVIICGKDAAEPENTIPIRKKLGMVFQNPNEQIVGAVICEEIAFGAENLQLPEAELKQNVLEALDLVGIPRDRYYDRVSTLSGGECQKLCLASVLAMKPECIVLDEATSMLDPRSRKEILNIVEKLSKEKGITVIIITHIAEEMLLADKIYVMDKGRIVLKGLKNKVLSNNSVEREKLKKYGVGLPSIVELKNRLVDEGLLPDRICYSVEELVKLTKSVYPQFFYKETKSVPSPKIKKRINPKKSILFDKVDFGYGKDNIIENMNLSVAKGEFTCIIGKIGSGKSTVLKLMDGIIKPKAGDVYIDGKSTSKRRDRKELLKLKSKIGYIFQNPNDQLFGTTVYEDVVFGPHNLDISKVEAEKRAFEAIELVGLSQDVYDYPMERLSGGMKRRVQIAGVLAMNPEYLILDEPLSGLDHAGKLEIMELIDVLHKEAGITVIMVCHDYDIVAKYADKVICLQDGRVKYEGSPLSVFYEMERAGKSEELPVAIQYLTRLREEGMEVNPFAFTIEETVNQLKEIVG